MWYNDLDNSAYSITLSETNFVNFFDSTQPIKARIIKNLKIHNKKSIF